MGRRPTATPYLVEERGHATPCWIFHTLDDKGYGKAHIEGRTCKAHRHYYEMHVGRIPEGLQIDHLCGIRACVNPAHLEPVTQEENMRRAGLVKLNATQVAQIKARPSDPLQLLADEFGVSRANIKNIRYERTWASVPAATELEDTR